MSETPKPLLQRLAEAGSTGLDLSPGDPLCHEAYNELTRTREALREALDIAEKWAQDMKDGTDYVRIAQLRKENNLE